MTERTSSRPTTCSRSCGRKRRARGRAAARLWAAPATLRDFRSGRARFLVDELREHDWNNSKTADDRHPLAAISTGRWTGRRHSRAIHVTIGDSAAAGEMTASPIARKRERRRGKSELRRAVRRVTPGRGNPKDSGTENIPPAFAPGASRLELRRGRPRQDREPASPKPEAGKGRTASP